MINWPCSRSPGHRVPWWVLIWIKRSPLAFLVLSVACFSIGLVLFAYSSNQVCRVSISTQAVFLTWFSTALGYLHTHHGLLCLQYCGPHSSVSMVRMRALDLLPTPRHEVARRRTLRDQNTRQVHAQCEVARLPPTCMGMVGFAPHSRAVPSVHRHHRRAQRTHAFPP